MAAEMHRETGMGGQRSAIPFRGFQGFGRRPQPAQPRAVLPAHGDFALPDAPVRRQPAGVLTEPETRAAVYESLLPLQTRILASIPADGHLVIAVCSALEGEGKTTVAVALAEMLGERFHRKTLLVDANLNRPDVHSLLETKASPGFKDCLNQGSVLTGTITWSGRVWVMPAGATPVVLSGAHHEPPDVMRQLRSLFSVTIVDLPAMTEPQSASLAPHWADHVVWVVKADHCPAHVVDSSMNLVGRDKVLGVVLNGHRTSLPGWLDRLL